MRNVYIHILYTYMGGEWVEGIGVGEPAFSWVFLSRLQPSRNDA